MFQRFVSIAILLCAVPAAPVSAADDGLAEPIRKGRQYLLKTLETEKTVGKLAISVVALQGSELQKDAGKAQDQRISKTIQSLHRLAERSPAALESGTESHYALAYTVLALVNDGFANHEKPIRALARLLASRQLDCGGWGYPNDVQADTSQTHHALLALSKAAQAGADVPRAVWEKAMLFHLRTQDSAGARGPGGFGYHPYIPKNDERKDQSETATMTISGYCSMLICKRRLEASAPAGPLGPPAGAAGKAEGSSIPAERMNKAIEEAERWVVGTSPYQGQFSSGARIYYFLAELERGAALRGKGSPFEKIAWHAAGADQILGRQREDGSFKGGEYDSADTSLALLFLSRATANENRPRVVDAVKPDPPVVAVRN